MDRFGDALVRQPVPEPLRQAVLGAMPHRPQTPAVVATPAAAGATDGHRRRIGDLFRVRGRRGALQDRPAPRRGRDVRLPVALAASVALLLGLGAGYLGLVLTPYPSLPSEDVGLAHGDLLLHRVLETSPSGVSLSWPVEPDATGPRRTVMPLLTFRDGDGRICREYEQYRIDPRVDEPSETFGIACRSSHGTWLPEAEMTRAMVTHTFPDASTESQYLPAGGEGSGALDRLIDQLIVGEPLHPDQERALLANGWAD